MYPSGNRNNVIPCSDGAGNVVAIGERVTRWQVGDRVCTLFNQSHLAGPLTAEARKTGLGNSLDGCLREYGRWREEGLVRILSLNYWNSSFFTLDYLHEGI